MAYKTEYHLFPEDCFIEILLKLPIKSILRFRCVSKSWYVFLISSYFINLHMKLNEKTKILFISSFEEKFSSFKLKDESFVSILDPHLKINNLAGYCNGIICFQMHNDNIVLLNPSTREFKVLPVLPNILNDDAIDIKSIGFGFDDLNNDYKVILIFSALYEDVSVIPDCFPYTCKVDRFPYTCEFAIYSFQSNAWRKLKNININPLATISDKFFIDSSNLLFNGRVHWDAHDLGYGDDRRFLILSMDISSEAFYEFHYPEPILLWKNSFQTNLQVIRGSLSVILFQDYRGHLYSGLQYIDIWSMKEYGVVETWSKQYTIGPLQISHVLSIRENEDEEEEDLLVLSRRMNEDEEEEAHSVLLKRMYEDEDDKKGPLYGWQLVRWNLLKNEQFQKYCLGDFYINMKVLCYSQSLVSIDKNKLDYI